MNKYNVIAIGGPTASGKSGLAIDLAKNLSGEIINADSMQVYKDTPVLSAVPDLQERDNIAHHLFEIYDSSFHGNVVDWLDLCVAKIKEIWKRGNLPIVVGGTGLYLHNLINGTTPIPPVSNEIREKIREEFLRNSLQYMYEKLQKIDEKTAARLSPNDKTRILRALEVFESSGIKLSEWYEKPLIQKLPEAKFFSIALLPPISELEERCSLRFDLMMEAGALNEVRELAKKNISADLPAMKALGVPELMKHINENIPLDEAIAEAKLHTRQYAKRQLTWFRNQMKADYVIDECYRRQKNLVDDIVKNHIKLLRI